MFCVVFWLLTQFPLNKYMHLINMNLTFHIWKTGDDKIMVKQQKTVNCSRSSVRGRSVTPRYWDVATTDSGEEEQTTVHERIVFVQKYILAFIWLQHQTYIQNKQT